MSDQTVSHVMLSDCASVSSHHFGRRDVSMLSSETAEPVADRELQGRGGKLGLIMPNQMFASLFL
jgi:hypothetical protein